MRQVVDPIDRFVEFPHIRVDVLQIASPKNGVASLERRRLDQLLQSRTNERTNERMNEWMNKRTNEHTNEQTNERRNPKLNANAMCDNLSINPFIDQFTN